MDGSVRLSSAAYGPPRTAEFDKKIVAENRRARFDYAIETVYEAGTALNGTRPARSCGLTARVEA